MELRFRLKPLRNNKHKLYGAVLLCDPYGEALALMDPVDFALPSSDDDAIYDKLLLGKPVNIIIKEV